jgi:hypothetical protein
VHRELRHDCNPMVFLQPVNLGTSLSLLLWSRTRHTLLHPVRGIIRSLAPGLHSEIDHDVLSDAANWVCYGCIGYILAHSK